MERHRKHAKLTRRDISNFATNEMAILGSKCSVIKNLVADISREMAGRIRLAYADASHDMAKEPETYSSYTFHPAGELQVQAAYRQNPYTDKVLFTSYDLLLINGNHYPGAQQILILDEEKRESVRKRLDQLGNVRFLISAHRSPEIFDFLLERHPYLANLSVYPITEIQAISDHIRSLVELKTAPVKGLVLAGGQSLRMGKDKGLLDYFGKSQRYYAVELLEKMNLQTFLSVRKEQKLEEKNRIEDVFLGLGPFGAICSAFQFDPNSAWLTLATDLPYVDEELIRRLLDHRDPSKVATAVKGKGKQFPEPLVTIWEPKAYPVLLQFLAQGISCPRKVLINTDVATVETDDAYIFNVNTPEEFETVKKEIRG